MTCAEAISAPIALQPAPAINVAPSSPRDRVSSPPSWLGKHRPRDLNRVNVAAHLRGVVAHKGKRELLVELVRDASGPLGFACARQTSYARRIERTVRTVHTYARALEADGLVHIVDRQGTNATYINWEALDLHALAPVFADRTARANASTSGYRTKHDCRSDLQSLQVAPLTDLTHSPAGADGPSTNPPTDAPARQGDRHPRGAAVRPGPRTGLALVDPPVAAPPGLLAAILREHGVEAEAVVESVLSAPEARANPVAALAALDALTTYGRDDVRTTLGRLFRWLVREAVAGRDQRNTITSGPKANTGAARIARAIDDAVQTGRLDEARRLREVAFVAGRLAADRIDQLELQDPGHARAQALIDAARAGALPLLEQPAPRPGPRGGAGFLAHLTRRGLLPADANVAIV